MYYCQLVKHKRKTLRNRSCEEFLVTLSLFKSNEFVILLSEAEWVISLPLDSEPFEISIPILTLKTSLYINTYKQQIITFNLTSLN